MANPKRLDLAALSPDQPKPLNVGALATEFPPASLASPVRQSPAQVSGLGTKGTASYGSATTCGAHRAASPGSFETPKLAQPYPVLPLPRTSSPSASPPARANGQHPCQQGKPCECGGTCKKGATPKTVSPVVPNAGSIAGRGCGCGVSRCNAGSWRSRGVGDAPPPTTRDSIEQFRSLVADSRHGSKPLSCSGRASPKPSRATSLVAADVRMAPDGRAKALPTRALKDVVRTPLSRPGARIVPVNLLIPGETREGLHCPVFREFSPRFIECMEGARQAANRILPPVNPWTPHLDPRSMREWELDLYVRDSARYRDVEAWCQNVRDVVRSRILGWIRARYEVRDGVARPTVLSPTRETWSMYRDETLEGRQGPWMQVFMQELVRSGCEDLTSDPDFFAFWHFAHTLMNDEGLQYVFPVPPDWLAPGTDPYFLMPPGLQECLDLFGPVPLFESPVPSEVGVSVPGIYPMPRGVWLEGCPQVTPGPIVDRWRSDLRPFDWGCHCENCGPGDPYRGPGRSMGCRYNCGTASRKHVCDCVPKCPISVEDVEQLYNTPGCRCRPHRFL